MANLEAPIDKSDQTYLHRKIVQGGDRLIESKTTRIVNAKSYFKREKEEAKAVEVGIIETHFGPNPN